MPRIFKGSESTLKLLVGKTNEVYDNLRILLYTTNIDDAIEVIDGITLDGNIAELNLASRAFLGLEDGLIRYKVEYVIDGDLFQTERESNYYLKSLSYISENGAKQQILNITENGEYKITPNDGAYVTIRVDVVGYEQGLTEGYNQGWADGYVSGESEGYGQGHSDGYDQGHSDGSNDGIEVGKAQIVEEAIVLDITENGTYYTQYDYDWDEPLTGDDFYSYLSIVGQTANDQINLGYIANETTVVELWFRHNGEQDGIIIFQKGRAYLYYGINVSGETGYFNVGSTTISTFPLPANIFNKIKFQNDTVWVNDELVNQGNGYVNYCCEYIIGSYLYNYGAIGDYGIIKIDDHTYTPCEDGFMDETGVIYTNSKIPFFFREVIKPQALNLIKKVNANIPINLKEKTDLRFGYSKFTEIPAYINLDGITDYNDMFYYCDNLTDISRLENLRVKSCNSIFNACAALTDASIVSTWDTSECTDMGSMFGGCNNLVKIGEMDCTSITTGRGYPFFFITNSGTLTDVGGFPNMKASSTDNYGFYRTSNLTRESYINIFNGLYDFTENGETPTSSQGQLKLHTNAQSLLSEEDLNIAINKGWTIIY